ASSDMSSPSSNADATQQKFLDLTSPAFENNEEEPINSAENGSHLSDFVFDSSKPVKPGEANYVCDYESVSEELPPATKSSSDTAAAAANSDIDYTDEASNKSSDTEEENNKAEEKSLETQTNDNQRDDVRGFFCYANSTPKRKEKPKKKLHESPSTPHASPVEPLKEREKEKEKLVENVVEEISKEGVYCSDDAISDSNDSFSSTQQNFPIVITHCSLDNENESIDADTEDEEYTTQKFSIVTADDERKEDESQPDTVKVPEEKQEVIKSLGEKYVAEFDIVNVDKEPEVVLFKHECKLFTFVNERKETLYFGLGDVMIKSLFNQKKFHQVDIVFVRHNDQRICADFTINGEMFLTDKTDAKNCGIITYKDNSDDVAIPTIFVIKFREKESYDEFKRFYNDAVENARASVKHGPENEKLTKSKLIAEAEQTGVPFKRPRTLCKSLSIQPPTATFGSVKSETSFSTSYVSYTPPLPTPRRPSQSVQISDNADVSDDGF
uniref:RanBD1 domain-containing protein n=1 Tax=Panagrolaimus sp. PS1159 TaxID=55785 RepID=A0AC35GGI9_9BILA